MEKFNEKCWEMVKNVPEGKVTTYKEIARALKTRAFRAVGNAMHCSPGMKKGVPCHRVVRYDGKVGGFALGTKKKIEMLKTEGVAIADNKVDLEKFFYRLR